MYLILLFIWSYKIASYSGIHGYSVNDRLYADAMNINEDGDTICPVCLIPRAEPKVDDPGFVRSVITRLAQVRSWYEHSCGWIVKIVIVTFAENQQRFHIRDNAFIILWPCLLLFYIWTLYYLLYYLFPRVSIPRSTLMSPYRVKPHRRKSFDPTDSCALSNVSITAQYCPVLPSTAQYCM